MNDTCPFCSRNPTSLGDYCVEHRAQLIARLKPVKYEQVRQQESVATRLRQNEGDYHYPAGLLDEGAARIEVLEAAIRAHRDVRGDDRCWRDDEALYGVLPEGYTPPERDTAVELENCKRYIASRQHPQTSYVSPDVTIAMLRDDVAQAQAENQKLRARAGILDDMQRASDHADSIMGADLGSYNMALVALALMARQYLRELKACTPLPAWPEPPQKDMCLNEHASGLLCRREKGHRGRHVGDGLTWEIEEPLNTTYPS